MGALTLLGILWVLAQEGGGSIPTSNVVIVVTAIIASCSGGAIFLVRKQGRKIAADTSVTITEANDKFAAMMKENVSAFEEQMRELRQQARIKDAEAAEAKAQLMLKEAELARERVESAEYRHAHNNQLALERVEWANKEKGYQQSISIMEKQIAEFDRQLGPLRAKGLIQDRRSDDPTDEGDH